MKRLYLDHNATAPLRPEVKAAWLAALEQLGGNPSSLHASGRRARHLLDQARERTAAALGVLEDEVVFTSGGTESNNLALFGALRAAGPGSSGVTTAIEHSSVLACATQLAAEKHPFDLIAVDGQGFVDVARLAESASAASCRLVSVMAANNEIGVCLPLAEIGARLSAIARPPLFHTDAVQALGRVALDWDAWGIDLATLSAHKLGGPVGVGVLVRRRGVALEPLLYGGEQEGSLRPGTENVASISAAALAIELAVDERERHARHLGNLAQAFWDELGKNFDGVRLLGPELAHAARLPGTLNLVARDSDGKVLVTRLDLAGLEVSAGSACASGSLEPSHVLLALGLDESEARAGLRVSFGRENTLADARQAVDILRRTFGVERATRADDRSS